MVKNLRNCFNFHYLILNMFERPQRVFVGTDPAVIEQYSSAATFMHPSTLQECRFPVKEQKKKKVTTHLLAHISEFIEEKRESKHQDFESLGCSDRIKKFIERKRQAESCHGLERKWKHSIHKKSNLEGQEIEQMLKVQGKLHHLRDKIEQENKIFEKQSAKMTIKKSGKKLPKTSKLCIFENSIQTTEKQNKRPKTQHCEDSKPNHHLVSRLTIKQQFIEHSYQQYRNWQRKKKNSSDSSIKEFIEQQIANKMSNLLLERDIKYNELLKQNSIKERAILQKNLQIQNLQFKQSELLKKVGVLEQVRQKYAKIQNLNCKKERQLYLQRFYEEFCEAFPQENVESLKKDIDRMVDKCLNKFDEVQSKNKEQWAVERAEWVIKLEKQQKENQKLKKSCNELREQLKAQQIQKNNANMQVDALLKDKQELKTLHKKILNIYNDWYSKLSEQEKVTMKTLNMVKGDYCYVDMLDYILFYKEKLSSEHKVYDYLIKVLRGIQRIRKILMPSNELQKQTGKKDPLKFMDKLEKYIKWQTLQTQLKKGQSFKDKIERIMEQDAILLKSSQTDIVQA